MHWAKSSAPHCQSLPTPDQQIVTEPVELTAVTNASVYFPGSKQVVMATDGTVVSRRGVDNTHLAEIPWQTHQHLAGTSLLLGDSAGARNYYHWTLDVLPKLGYLERAEFDLDSIDHFLVRDAKTPFQLESLMKLGIDESRIIETASQPHLSCDKALLLPLKHRVNMSMHPFAPAWVNSMFGDTDNAHNSTDDTTKLYLKRPPGGRRGITNEDELEALLVQRGFETVVMTGLSIAQQAHLLAKADIVISPHGGTLTNIVYAKPGTKIIELFGSHVYPYYFGLANLCNHEYHALLQNPQDYAKLVQVKAAMNNGNAANQSITQFEEFSVDMNALDQAISACLS